MKRSILLITLVMVFGLFCNSSLWAGNGKGAGDGSMLDVGLTEPIIFVGVVSDAGIAGSGLSIDDGTEITTIYGMGPLGYWNSIEVLKPAIGDSIEVAAVLVTFTDGSERWIAVSVSIEGESDPVLLRTVDGPAWRGINKQSGTSNGLSDGSGCVSSGNCGQAQGNGTGTCPLITE